MDRTARMPGSAIGLMAHHYLGRAVSEMRSWISIDEQLPENGARVLCYLPSNSVYLPGKTGAREERNVIVLRFLRDHFLSNPSKTGYTGVPHFWQGEGSSNHFFTDVTHWMPLPEAP